MRPSYSRKAPPRPGRHHHHARQLHCSRARLRLRQQLRQPRRPHPGSRDRHHHERALRRHGCGRARPLARRSRDARVERPATGRLARRGLRLQPPHRHDDRQRGEVRALRDEPRPPDLAARQGRQPHGPRGRATPPQGPPRRRATAAARPDPGAVGHRARRRPPGGRLRLPRGRPLHLCARLGQQVSRTGGHPQADDARRPERAADHRGRHVARPLRRVLLAQAAELPRRGPTHPRLDRPAHLRRPRRRCVLDPVRGGVRRLRLQLEQRRRGQARLDAPPRHLPGQRPPRPRARHRADPRRLRRARLLDPVAAGVRGARPRLGARRRRAGGVARRAAVDAARADPAARAVVGPGVGRAGRAPAPRHEPGRHGRPTASNGPACASSPTAPWRPSRRVPQSRERFVRLGAGPGGLGARRNALSIDPRAERRCRPIERAIRPPGCPVGRERAECSFDGEAGQGEAVCRWVGQRHTASGCRSQLGEPAGESSSNAE